MSNNSLPSECDVVVIGAGIAGLTASALLSKAGLNVALVEEQPQPGGYFAGFTRKGFSFSSSIHWLNQCKEGGLVNRIFSHIGPDFPVCKEMKRIRRYKGESFDYFLTTDPYDLRDQLIRDYPEDAKGIARFFEDCKRIGAHFDKLKALMRATETMSLAEKNWFGLKMLLWALPIAKYLRMPAEKGLNRYFKTEGVRKIFCSEERFMGIIMPFCWAFTKDFQSPPEGGSAAFVTWLRGKIEQASSHLILNCAVEKVLVKDKRATGVSLSDGRVISAKYVIAACDAGTLYEKMFPAGTVSAGSIRRLQNADLYYSSLMVYLGLDCDTSLLGLREELTCITRDNIAREDHAGGDPHKTFLIVQTPSFRDPGAAPRGKSTLTIHCAAWMHQENCWRTEKDFGRGKAYRELKQQYADILIARVEKALNVDLRNHIEVMEIATPVTYWRYSKNRDGTTMGAKPTGKNINRNVAHYRTPLKNVFLGGHWAEYGGGMLIAVKAAANASLLILKQMEKKEFAALRDVMDDK
jgi:prolycopene isomerase